MLWVGRGSSGPTCLGRWGGSRRGVSRQQAPRRLAGSASGTSVHVSSQSVALADAFGVRPPVLSLRAEPLRRVSLSR